MLRGIELYAADSASRAESVNFSLCGRVASRRTRSGRGEGLSTLNARLAGDAITQSALQSLPSTIKVASVVLAFQVVTPGNAGSARLATFMRPLFTVVGRT